MTYSQMDLTGPTVVARGLSLPDWLAPLGASFEQITDCGWAGHPGVGYWQEIVAEPNFDPATEALTGAIVWGDPDEATKTVPGSYGVRALTEEEIAARQPRPRALTKMQFLRLMQSAGGFTDIMLVAADAEPQLKPFWLKLGLTTELQRDDADTRAGMDALVAFGFVPNGVQSVIDAWPTG